MKLPEERFAAKTEDIALWHSYSFIKETSKKILAFSQSCCVGGFFFFFFSFFQVSENQPESQLYCQPFKSQRNDKKW